MSIERFNASDFLGEFPASQVKPLVDALNRIVDQINEQEEEVPGGES